MDYSTTMCTTYIGDRRGLYGRPAPPLAQHQQKAAGERTAQKPTCDRENVGGIRHKDQFELLRTVARNAESL